jgi:peptide/nickel transport system ATP-binding protein
MRLEKLLETKELYTNFNTFEGVVKALNGVSVFVNQGETYGLVGESGCGKSVTVRSMMRIVQSPGKIVNGKILLFFRAEDRSRGIDILKRSETYMTSIRGDDISMIFQEASTSLNPVLSIGYQVGESFNFHRRGQMLEETIEELTQEMPKSRFFLVKGWKLMQRLLFKRELGALRSYESQIDAIDDQLYRLENEEDEASLRRLALLKRRRDRLRETDALIQVVKRVPFLRRYAKRLNKTVRKHVTELLRNLGVPNPDRVVDGYPHELSGGMQQRIVIAIALACNPILLIADEPTSNLDVTIQAQIVDLIKTLKQTTISSVLFITHDLGLVAEVCDRASVMYAGDVVETTSVRELFKNPLHPYTRGLLRSVPKVEQTATLNMIPGVVPNLIHPPSGCRFHPRCPHAMTVCAQEKPPIIEHSPGHTVACYNYTDKEQ